MRTRGVRMGRVLGLGAPAVLAAATAAQPIALVNPNFELPTVPAGGFIGGGGPTSTTVPGWVYVSGSADWGVFYPTVASWQYTAPEGNQLLFLNNQAVVEQATSTLAQAGQTYSLQVEVVRRPGFFQQAYVIQLRAGSVVLAADNGTLTPVVGGSLTSTLVATVPPGSPAVGQPITVRLSGPTQTNFDRVRVFAGPPPGSCYPNCDGSTTVPSLNALDFGCFLSRYQQALGLPGSQQVSAYANCDGSTTVPALNALDFSCFLNRYRAGCP